MRSYLSHLKVNIQTFPFRNTGMFNYEVRPQTPLEVLQNTQHTRSGQTIKFANFCCSDIANLFLISKGLFIMNLYQLDKQLTTFTIWKC